MRRVVVAALALALMPAPRAFAQSSASTQGRALFGEQCATCHGADARGLNGPNLLTVVTAAGGEARARHIIRNGVPGSIMSASRGSDDEIAAIVAYLKMLATPPTSSAAYLRPGANADLVTLTLHDGRVIPGERKNEDAFSIQILEPGGRLQGYWKSAIANIARGARAAANAVPLPGVTYRDLLDGLKDPSRWVTFSGDYSGRRHSPLTQINTANVATLKPEWTFQTGTTTRGRGFEATPLLYDGVLYVSGSNNFAWALDARTGRPFWSYRRDLPADLTYGAQAPVNRGFAMLDHRLFMVTLDAHLLAFDRATGRILWDTVLADYKVGYSATLAPLVINGKVIVGISGGEYPTKGFLDAYDPATGARLWRFSTIPAPGERGSETWPASADVLERGGGGTWMTGTYDPDLNLLYWGTGNPNPDYYGADRRGDNLYTNSLIAIDADTGTLKWHYQFTPHDTHDWDANQIPVLADWPDSPSRGSGATSRKVVMLANRNGFFYVLDRRTGELILGKPFTDTTWAREIGKDGRPIVLNDGDKGCLPDMWGGTNFNPPSFDPALKLFFVNARESCATYEPQEPVIAPGRTSFGGVVRIDRDKGYGALRALDAATGERKWEFKFTQPTMAGVMSTAAGLVFAGDNEGNFMAFDSRSGRNLWRYSTGYPIWGAAAMTFMLDGKQHVVIASGTTLLAFALP
ncbi:MAG: PQQ-dependent dehydrogenase, methanol/ethanol family [Acidimicrobiia bacterium]|nr:PQQ-dependent dehydrogenase, methanol/ethanol family [Acidimicrobiia bacterium]